MRYLCRFPVTFICRFNERMRKRKIVTFKNKKKNYFPDDIVTRKKKIGVSPFSYTFLARRDARRFLIFPELISPSRAMRQYNADRWRSTDSLSSVTRRRCASRCFFRFVLSHRSGSAGRQVRRSSPKAEPYNIFYIVRTSASIINLSRVRRCSSIAWVRTGKVNRWRIDAAWISCSTSRTRYCLARSIRFILFFFSSFRFAPVFPRREKGHDSDRVPLWLDIVRAVYSTEYWGGGERGGPRRSAVWWIATRSGGSLSLLLVAFIVVIYGRARAFHRGRQQRRQTAERATTMHNGTQPVCSGRLIPLM